MLHQQSPQLLLPWVVFSCHYLLAVECQVGFHNHHGAHCLLASPTSAILLFPDLGAFLLTYKQSHLILLIYLKVFEPFFSRGSPVTSTSTVSFQTDF